MFTHRGVLVFAAEFETPAVLSELKWKMSISFLSPPVSPQFTNRQPGCESQADFVDDLQVKSTSVCWCGSFFYSQGFNSNHTTITESLLPACSYVLHTSRITLVLSRETLKILLYFGCPPGNNKSNYIGYPVQHISNLRK